MTTNENSMIDKHNNSKLTYDTMENIYIYKNDPKVVNKGVYISNFQHFEGGYLPILHHSNYNKRKMNNNYSYDDRIHHGQRPMHKTTLSLSDHDSNVVNNYITHNKIKYQGEQLKPEYYHNKFRDEFKPNFHISNGDSQRYLESDYQSQFYNKNDKQEYKNSFDLMPKYSLPKKMNQLEKYNQVKVYKYHTEFDQTKDILKYNNENNYWTQYKRTHGYLGALKGTGELKEFPSRPSYNIFTGEKLQKPSWSVNTNFKRMSGNLTLINQRTTKSNILN